MKYRLFAVLFLFLMANVACWQFAVAPTPQPIRSIFDYDTCAPPCWMGLIPGESTVEDVEQMLEMNREIISSETVYILTSRLSSGEYDIDPDTGVMRTGGVFFDVGDIRDINLISSRIEIREGFVDLIVITNHENTPLAQVIQRLGTPEIIRLHIGMYANEIRLRLIYTEFNMVASLTMEKENCRTSEILEETRVEIVVYYSPIAANRVLGPEYSEYETSQTALTLYIFRNERDVPIELWQSWLVGEVDMPCEQAWSQLPVPEITPSVEATPTAP